MPLPHIHPLALAKRRADTTSAFYVRRKPLSATINTLANALYKVGGVVCTAERTALSCCGHPRRELRRPTASLAAPSLCKPQRPVSAPLRLPPPKQVFCASDNRAHEEMRQACFDYLALGGMYSGAPRLCLC